MIVCLLLARGIGDDENANMSIPCDSAATAKLLRDFYESRGWRNLHITGWMAVQTYDEVVKDLAAFIDP